MSFYTLLAAGLFAPHFQAPAGLNWSDELLIFLGVVVALALLLAWNTRRSAADAPKIHAGHDGHAVDEPVLQEVPVETSEAAAYSAPMGAAGGPELGETYQTEALPEKPIAETPVIEAPVAAEPAVELPAAAETEAQIPAVEEPSIEIPPTVETPAVEMPAAAGPAVQVFAAEPLVEMDAAAGPAAQAPTIETRAAEMPVPAAPTTVEVFPVPAPIPAEDDLTILEGIGPRIAQILKGAGIHTFAQLGQAETAWLESILAQAHLQMADPGTWPEQARLAAAGEWQKLTELTAQLKGGRRIQKA